MTQIADWGPHMWKLLHSCAERAGNSVVPLDEARAWVLFLKLTGGALPCATCREHYKQWRLANPITAFSTMRGYELREAVRLWLWRLHEAVNGRREEVVHYPYEELEKYGEVTTAELNQTMRTLYQELEKAVHYRQVNAEYVVDWKRAVALLRKLIGI